MERPATSAMRFVVPLAYPNSAKTCQALNRTDFALCSVASANAAQPGLVEVRAELAAEHRDDKQLETAISRLSLEPSVTSVRWQAAAALEGALSGVLDGAVLDAKSER